MMQTLSDNGPNPLIAALILLGYEKLMDFVDESTSDKASPCGDMVKFKFFILDNGIQRKHGL